MQRDFDVHFSTQILTYFYHDSMNWAMHDHCYYLNYLNLSAHWWAVVLMLYAMPMNVDCLWCYCWTMMMMIFYSLMILMTVMMIWILWRLMLVCSVSSVSQYDFKFKDYYFLLVFFLSLENSTTQTRLRRQQQR